MAAPPKPWEKGTNPVINQRQATFHPDLGFSSSSSSGGGGSTYLDGRPPLPPRPTTSQNSLSRPYYNNYNSYSPYSSYGGSMMGGYGTYGGFNRYGMVGAGLTVPDENRFIQVAEDSSRQAFQSIESIVHAFGSVSMMLESTYHAVYSSFRAVLGVAEHFSRMKSHFAQIFSALAIVRTLKWIMRKLLYIIGFRSQDPSLEAAWHSAANTAAASLTEADLKQSRSSWPIVMFFAVVFGGPYLIWHLLSSLVPSNASQKSQEWQKGISEHYAAVALYSFQAGTKKELSFQAGQNLFLAPRDLQPHVRGWLLASNGKQVGLVPGNYVKILGLQKGSPHQAAVQSSGVPRVRVAPGIPSMPTVNQGEQPLASPVEFGNNSSSVWNASQSATYGTRGHVPGGSEKEDLCIIENQDQRSSIVPKLGKLEPPRNTEGHGRLTVSGQETEKQNTENNELCTDLVVAGETVNDLAAQSVVPLKTSGTADEGRVSKVLMNSELDMNDTSLSRPSPGAIKCVSSHDEHLTDQILLSNDKIKRDDSASAEVEGARNGFKTDKIEACYETGKGKD